MTCKLSNPLKIHESVALLIKLIENRKHSFDSNNKRQQLDNVPE